MTNQNNSLWQLATFELFQFKWHFYLMDLAIARVTFLLSFQCIFGKTLFLIWQASNHPLLLSHLFLQHPTYIRFQKICFRLVHMFYRHVHLLVIFVFMFMCLYSSVLIFFPDLILHVHVHIHVLSALYFWFFFHLTEVFRAY